MRRPLRDPAFALTALLLASLAAPRARGDADPAQSSNYQKDVAPFLAKYCTSCHGGGAPKGGLKLDTFPDAASALKERETWENAQLLVEDQSMPPKGKPQPTAAEREAFIAWAQSALSTVDCTAPPNPGRVTMRRLNRSEYNNTIRDLVGVHFRPAADFPSDDVGYGFDNIGDVLTLPPLLMEKYLAAAAAVMDEAIQTPEAAQTVSNRVVHKDSRGLGTTGDEVAIAVDFPFSGEYDLVVTAWGDQAGDEPAKMGLKLDGQPANPEPIEVKGGRRGAREFSQRIKATRGEHTVAAVFLNDFHDENIPDRRRRDRNLHVDQVAIVGPYNAEPAPPGEIHRRLFAPGEAAPDEESRSRAILADFAGRAFRRPAPLDGIDRYVALARKVRGDGNSPERAVQVALTAVLVSPNFLFRAELDPATPDPTGKDGRGEAISLDDWELASRLSYFLWSSMPDPELFEAAQRGRLRDPAELERQALRMLRDPKADALVENFATQWLTIRRLDTIVFDRKRFPDFDNRLRRDMLEETSRFFAHVMRDDSIGIQDLLDGQYSFLNERLAKHYGIEGVQGDEFRRVELTDGRRGGVVTQGSVLAVTSNPTRTSPVKRGKYILEQILGTPPPPPPPDVPELAEEGEALKGTLRQRMEQHRANPSCASCHARMDGLGFALENFDPVGAWRDKDGPDAIDASGELPDGTKFDGPSELRQVLRKQQDRFRKTFVEKLLTYALGRGLDYDDACVVDAIAGASEAGGDRFGRIVAEIAKSEPFRRKRGDSGDAAGAEHGSVE